MNACYGLLDIDTQVDNLFYTLFVTLDDLMLHKYDITIKLSSSAAENIVLEIPLLTAYTTRC